MLQTPFLKRLDQIEECRMSGFVEQALLSALILPDNCGHCWMEEKKNNPDNWPKHIESDESSSERYKQWIQYWLPSHYLMTIYNACVQPEKDKRGHIYTAERVAANIIYKIRNTYVHENNIAVDNDNKIIGRIIILDPKYDMSAACKYPIQCLTDKRNTPYIVSPKYIIPSVLIYMLISAAYKYYETGDCERQCRLDGIMTMRGDVIYEDCY